MNINIQFLLRVSFFCLLFLYSSLGKAITVVQSNNSGVFHLTPTSVVAENAVVSSGDITNWMQNSTLTWSIEIQKTGKYLIKADLASDWTGASIMATINGESVTSFAITNDWGLYKTDVNLGIIDIQTSGVTNVVFVSKNGSFNIKKFSLIPVNNSVIDLSPRFATTSIYKDMNGNISEWTDSSLNIIYDVDIPQAGYYSLSGSMATDASLPARLSLTVGANSAIFNVLGARGWSYFYYDSSNTIYIPNVGRQLITISREGSAGFYGANINNLFLTLQTPTSSDKAKDEQNRTRVIAGIGYIDIINANSEIEIYNISGTRAATYSKKLNERFWGEKGGYIVKIGNETSQHIIR